MHGKQATGFRITDILYYKVIVQYMYLQLPSPCNNTQVTRIGGNMHGSCSQCHSVSNHQHIVYIFTDRLHVFSYWWIPFISISAEQNLTREEVSCIIL